MKKKIGLVLIALLCVVLFASFSKPQTTKTTTQFEYKFEFNCNEKKANQLGADGWQLVGIESASGKSIAGNVSTYVFKREK